MLNDNNYKLNFFLTDGGQEVARKARPRPEGFAKQGVKSPANGDGAGANQTRAGPCQDGCRQG